MTYERNIVRAMGIPEDILYIRVINGVEEMLFNAAGVYYLLCTDRFPHPVTNDNYWFTYDYSKPMSPLFKALYLKE